MRRQVLIATSLVFALSACGSPPAQSPAPAAEAPATGTAAPHDVPRYPLHGKIVRVDKAGKKLIVDHGNIPGFMSAMTMPYGVKDETLLATLSPGVEIDANVAMSGASYWLEDVRVTAKTRPER